MLVTVDLRGVSPSVRLIADAHPDSVTVWVDGGDRSTAENVLLSAGAGCIPGHYAELRVAWLLATCSSDDGNRPWLRPDRLDESGAWLAAPIQWSDIKWPDRDAAVCLTGERLISD
jgi:hypothetical protein